MKLKKLKLLLVVLSITALITFIIITLLQPKTYAFTTDDGKFEYFINDDMTALIVKCNDIGDGESNVVIPEKIGEYMVTEIISEVFTGSWIESIYVPSSITSIAANSIDDCPNLKSINVDENNPNYFSSNGILFNKNSTCIISYPQGKQETEYTIPSTVTNIEAGAFKNSKNLISIHMPDSVTSINTGAFKDCANLTNVNLSSKLTQIEENTFYGCQSLENIRIPDGVTKIGKRAFYFCISLANITIPENVTNIEERAFESCIKLSSINIPSKITNIGLGAFEGCRYLNYFEVDENNLKYKSVDGILFNKDKTDLIQYPAGKTAESFEIPIETINIGEYAFYYCENLKNITISQGVQNIRHGAFSYCTSLTNMIIPENVNTIEEAAFRYCESLTNVHFERKWSQYSRPML